MFQGFYTGSTKDSIQLLYRFKKGFYTKCSTQVLTNDPVRVRNELYSGVYTGSRTVPLRILYVVSTVPPTGLYQVRCRANNCSWFRF